MSSRSFLIPENLYGYFQSVSLREHAVLKELRELTGDLPHGRMQISPEQGQLLQLLVKLAGAKRCLEVGVFTGYSALCVALALPEEGRIIACDINVEWTDIAQRFWTRAGIADKIELRLAPAAATLRKLIAEGHSETFDFAFIDADKGKYLEYYEQCYRLLRHGGLIAIDNTLWSGKPADPTDQSESTIAIRAVNQKIFQDERVFIAMLPIGDGLTLALKH